MPAEIASEFTVTISCGGNSVDYGLTSCVPADAISFEQAVDAAKNEFDCLNGNYEIRARIIKNPIDGSGVCWHVSFYSENIDCGVLLDPVSAKVIAKKN